MSSSPLADCYLQGRQKQHAIEQWRLVASMEPTYPNHDDPIDVAKKLLVRHD